MFRRRGDDLGQDDFCAETSLGRVYAAERCVVPEQEAQALSSPPESHTLSAWSRTSAREAGPAVRHRKA